MLCGSGWIRIKLKGRIRIRICMSKWLAGSRSGSASICRWKAKMYLSTFIKLLCLYLEAESQSRSRIRILIKLKGRIRIRIKVTSRIRIRICIEMISRIRIRIRINVMRILNTGTGTLLWYDTVPEVCRLAPIPATFQSRRAGRDRRISRWSRRPWPSGTRPIRFALKKRKKMSSTWNIGVSGVGKKL